MTDTKRKADFITLESSKDSAKKAKSDQIDNGENSYENYVLYSDQSGELKEINDMVKLYIDTLAAGLIKHNRLNKFKYCIDMFINIIEQIKNSRPEFFKQKNFKNLIKFFSNDIKQCTTFEDIPDHNVELVIELKRFLIPAESADAKDKTLSKDEVAKRAEKITKALSKIEDQISKLENQGVSLDEMADDTVYTKLPRLYNLAVKLWREREKLLKRSDFTGRKLFGVFTYKGTSSPEVNKIVEKFFTAHLNKFKHTEDKILGFAKSKPGKKKSSKNEGKFQFFTVIDLKTHLTSEIEKAKIDFELCDQTLTKIYKDLLTENKNRRLNQQHDAFRSLVQLRDLKPDNVANEDDPEFNKQMDENSERGQKSLKSVVDRYREIDYKQNGSKLEEGKPLGWDDKEGSDSSEEDESYEEDNEDEEEDDDDDDSVAVESKSEPTKKDEKRNNSAEVDEIVLISDDDD